MQGEDAGRANKMKKNAEFDTSAPFSVGEGSSGIVRGESCCWGRMQCQ